MRTTRLAASWLALLASAQPAASQPPGCRDIEFESSTIDEFPSVAESCHSVVERDGKLYVRLVAEVVRVSSDGSLVLALRTPEGLRIRQDFEPPPGFAAIISGKPTPARALVRGQEIRIYLPSSRWRPVDRPGPG